MDLVQPPPQKDDQSEPYLKGGLFQPNLHLLEAASGAKNEKVRTMPCEF